MRRHAPLLALFVLLLTSSVATAQAPIDRGTVNFTGSYILYPLAQFTFEGSQSTTLTGALRVGLFHPQCGPCLGGQTTSIGSSIADSSSVPGTLRIGNEISDVYFSAFLTFSGSPVTLPIRYSRLPFRITVPIAAQGVVSVHKSDPFNIAADPIFVFPVNLQGTATVTLRLQGILYNGKPDYKVIGATYEFPAAAETEEN